MGCGMSRLPRERLYYSDKPGDDWDAQYAAHRQGVRNATSNPLYQAELQREARNNKIYIQHPNDYEQRPGYEPRPHMPMGINRISQFYDA